MENNGSFEFTYSAPEQEEIRRIREKYTPREETKLDKLKRLDASVTQKGTMLSIILGTISCLVLGVGMCCCLVWTNLFILGIPVGIAGIIGVILAYPVYQRITEKERERLAPEILKLAAELESQI